MIPMTTPLAGLIFAPLPLYPTAGNTPGGGAPGAGGQRPPAATPAKGETA